MTATRSSRSNSSVSSVSVRSGSSSVTAADGGMERGAWGGKLEFILTCIGFAVGLGNVWRFPYLLYQSGGGAFLIPFVIMLFIIGIPLFFLELNFGQFASLGPLTIWNISPIMKGIGFAGVFTNLCVALYYNVIICWCLYYLFASMTDVLPWVDCDNYWNTPYCRTTAAFANMTDNETIIIDNVTVGRMQLKSPSEEYYYNKVLQMSDGVGETGTIIWQLALCLLLCWLIVFFVLIKGIGSLGKVVYVTSIFPYILLTIMLIRGVTLEGAALGIEFYLIPDWSKLADPKVWSDAATQIFYALSTCTGGLIAMSSYNDFHNNTLRDSLIVPIVNVLTSFYAGFVIFSVLGYMATMKGVAVADVAADGPGLVFVVYPEGLATMPIAPLWSILFFIMMMMLGLSSMFSMIECVFSGFMDEYPGFLRKSYWHTVGFRAVGCICFYLVSLPMVTNGGFYIFTLFDKYTGSFPLLFVGLFELITICYIYGYDNYADDVKMMLGKKPNIIFRIAWQCVSPLAVTAIIVFTGVYYAPPTLFSGLYLFPAWAEGIGWAIVAFCLAPLPIIFLYVMCKEGAYKIIYRSSQPNSLWHPAADKNRTGRYERVRRRKKEKDVDPDKVDINSDTKSFKESGYTDLQTSQPQSIYATVNKGENGIHEVDGEHKGGIHESHGHNGGIHEGDGHNGSIHEGHGHNASIHEGHGHNGSIHKGHGHNGSIHEGDGHNGSIHEGDGHNGSIHEGHEHNGSIHESHGHGGVENKGFDHDGDGHSSDDEKRSTDGSHHESGKHASEVHRSRSPSPVSHGGHFDTAAF